MPPADTDCNDQNIINPPITQADGCPVLPKMQCHEIQQGQDARLEWVMRTPNGDPVNLTDCAASCASEDSTSNETFDAAGTPPCGITLRIRELSGYDGPTDAIYSVDADITEAATGAVKAHALPEAITRYPGVYMEEWALFSADNRMLFSNQAVCFVGRGLFGISSDGSQWNLGPPTVSEIRLSMRDNAPNDNLLLDDVEFDAAEITQAVLRPLQFWNETPPPIGQHTTKTFPFRELWLKGIQAYLLQIAAANYRRNHLAYNAGGVAVDDKNKARAYEEYANLMMQDFRNMVQAKKVEINIAGFSGTVTSNYSGMF